MIEIPEGYVIEPSMYVSDYVTVNRTWKERLFTRPWNPFQKVKAIKEPKAYLLNGRALVSYETFAKIQKEKDESGTY